MLSAKWRLISSPPNNALPFAFLSTFLLLCCLLPALRRRVFYFVEEISIVTEVLRLSSSPSVDLCLFRLLRAAPFCFFLISSFSFPFSLYYLLSAYFIYSKTKAENCVRFRTLRDVNIISKISRENWNSVKTSINLYEFYLS